MRLRGKFSILLTTIPYMTMAPGTERVPRRQPGRTQAVTDAPALLAADGARDGSAALIGIASGPAA